MIPVVGYGVTLYLNKNLESRTSSGPVNFFTPAFTVCTSHLASPFEEGWYGGVGRCSMPLQRKNSWNSFDVNEGPLSETIIWGRPCVANVEQSLLMAAVEDVDGTMCASIHLEYASTIMRSVFPNTGPA